MAELDGRVSVKRRALPPIPATMPSVLGPVPVRRVKGLRNSADEACFGIWRADRRTVELEEDAALTTVWHTYWHEWTHVALWDAGLHGIDLPLEERICDAFATARVREMLDGAR